MSRPWSIEQRLFRWIAGSAIVMSLLYSAAVVWFVDSTLERELDVLGVEEIGEFAAETRGRRIPLEHMQDLLRGIANDHPEYRFSWRLWRDGGAEPWLTFGWSTGVELPATWEAAGAAQRAPDASLRWHVAELPVLIEGEAGPMDLGVGLLLDGGPRRGAAQRSVSLVLGVIALTAIVAIIGGRFLTRKVARTLKAAADHARDLDHFKGKGSIQVQDAPLEVHAVADAFENSLSALRAQHTRNLLLTAGMAHELRSPLQNMMSEVSVALLRDRDSDEYRAVLESQLEELRDLGRVVDNLITLTALREPGALDRKERICLGTQAETRFAKEASRAEKRGIRFEFDRTGDLTLMGDREALMLALRNLVDNAVRCAPENGHVAVHLEGDDAGISATVDDDGPGVPDHVREAIFQPFAQAPVRAGRRGGFGLGLALARAAVEAHGGTIRVGVSPLGGARFEVRLPRAAGSNSETPSPAGKNGVALG